MKAARIDPRDLVLCIVGLNKNQRIEGRTFLQKLAYFVNEKLHLGVDFEPYYYGPYSQSITMATRTLVALDFLKEEEERFLPSSSGVFEPRRYTYTLTDAGEIVLQNFQKTDPKMMDSLRVVMQTITSRDECNYECLSLAAKVVHILKCQRKVMSESELISAARDLGWELEKQDVERAAEFLKGLSLVREVPKPSHD